MTDHNYALTAASQKSLAALGKNIRHARMLRRITQEHLSARAGISRSTVQEIEKGSPNVSMGNYVKILEVMGIENHLERIATYDKLWITSFAEELSGRKRVR